jgi:hypothetical protein
VKWIALFILCLSAPSMADELQTKDGKKVEFKLLSDEGDFWELTTPQGTKVTVKKADFDKLIPSGLKEAPLTGASFAFDKKRKLGSLDLLSRIDVKRDTVTPDWKLAGGALTGSQTGSPTKLQTTFTPPEEYDLTLVVEQKDVATGGLFIGLIGGGKQFLFGLGDSFSGIDNLNGQTMADSGIGIAGRIFASKAPRTINFMVRKDVLIVQADGKDHFAWKADWNKVSVRASLAVQSQNTLFFTISRSESASLTYRISRMTITFPKD